MWWLTALLLIVLISTLYLLFAPFYIELNSHTGLYRFRFHRLVSLSAKFVNSAVVFELKILFWKRPFTFHQTAERNIQPTKYKKSNKTKKRNLRIQTVVNMLRSFKINTCDIALDTGDVVLNGRLYPLFYLLGFFTRKPILISFTGQSHIVLEIENNLARLSRALIIS
jgi:hypothetical protein